MYAIMPSYEGMLQGPSPWYDANQIPYSRVGSLCYVGNLQARTEDEKLHQVD